MNTTSIIPKKTQKKLERIWSKISKLTTEARVTQQALIASGTCDHSQTRNYEWEHDNGYGRQSKHVGQQCRYCGFIDHYNHGRFFNPKDLSD